MAKFVCSICGYVYEGDKAPDGKVRMQHLRLRV